MTRADTIIRDAERAARAYRLRIEGDGAAEAQHLIGTLSGHVRTLAAELDVYRSGPPRSHAFADTCEVSLWGAPVLVEYEETEDGTCLGQALINGAWVDAEQFDADVLHAWRRAIWAHIEKRERMEAEDAHV